jgi:hypothetical protein
MDLLPPDHVCALLRFQDTLWQGWVLATFRTSLVLAAVSGLCFARGVLQSRHGVPRNGADRPGDREPGVTRRAG